MKPGKTLQQLAEEMNRIQKSKKDFIVPTELLSMSDDAKLEFRNGTQHTQELTPWANQQLAGYLDIPKAYYDRLRSEAPALLSKNVNHGLVKMAKTSTPTVRASRMIRTIDGRARAVLSSRYRILDGYDMLESVLPDFQKHGLDVDSCEITDKRLYIKASSPKLTAEVKVGDAVQYGIMLSTSDVGAGGLRVEPFMNRLVCMNGMVMNDIAMNKKHIGRNQSGSDFAEELLSDETKNASDAAFWLTVRDIVRASMSPEYFKKQVDVLRLAANEKIVNFDLPRVVELAMTATATTGENVKNGILAALANGTNGAGMTKWGLINAFTQAAHEVKELDYDAATELERAGGKILELPASQWKLISAA